ncbi:MAG: hypothetical protein K9L61_05035, partial [Candidatus Omnitrophica bacterium]|nr:hypothetical protein [Candidatus Omnitrophota bacterium]
EYVRYQLAAIIVDLIREYRVDSGKITGPPAVAYYDEISNEIIYNIDLSKLQTATAKFIENHENLHKNNPYLSEEAVLIVQIRQLVAEGSRHSRLPNDVDGGPATSIKSLTQSAKRIAHSAKGGLKWHHKLFQSLSSVISWLPAMVRSLLQPETSKTESTTSSSAKTEPSKSRSGTTSNHSPELSPKKSEHSQNAATQKSQPTESTQQGSANEKSQVTSHKSQVKRVRGKAITLRNKAFGKIDNFLHNYVANTRAFNNSKLVRVIMIAAVVIYSYLGKGIAFGGIHPVRKTKTKSAERDEAEEGAKSERELINGLSDIYLTAESIQEGLARGELVEVEPKQLGLLDRGTNLILTREALDALRMLAFYYDQELHNEFGDGKNNLNLPRLLVTSTTRHHYKQKLIRADVFFPAASLSSHSTGNTFDISIRFFNENKDKNVNVSRAYKALIKAYQRFKSEYSPNEIIEFGGNVVHIALLKNNTSMVSDSALWGNYNEDAVHALLKSLQLANKIRNIRRDDFSAEEGKIIKSLLKVVKKLNRPYRIKQVEIKIVEAEFAPGGHAERIGEKAIIYVEKGSGLAGKIIHELGAAVGLEHKDNKYLQEQYKKYGELFLTIFKTFVQKRIKESRIAMTTEGKVRVQDPAYLSEMTWSEVKDKIEEETGDSKGNLSSSELILNIYLLKNNISSAEELLNSWKNRGYKVLDIGCGQKAEFVRALREYGIEAYGIDKNLDLKLENKYLIRGEAQQAVNILGEIGVNNVDIIFAVNFLNSDFMHLNKDRTGFEPIISFEDRKVIAENINQLLKEDGMFLAITDHLPIFMEKDCNLSDDFKELVTAFDAAGLKLDHLLKRFSILYSSTSNLGLFGNIPAAIRPYLNNLIKQRKYSAITRFKPVEADGVKVNFFKLDIPSKPDASLPENVIYSSISEEGLSVFINDAAERLILEKFSTARKLSIFLNSLAKHEKVEAIDGLSHFEARIKQTEVEGYSEIADILSSIQDTDKRIDPTQAEIRKPAKGCSTVIHRNSIGAKKAALGLVNLDNLVFKINTASDPMKSFHLRKSFTKFFNRVIEKFVEGLPDMGHDTDLVELLESVTTEKDKENLISHKLSGNKIVKAANEEESLYQDLIDILGEKIDEKIGEDAPGVEQDKLDKALDAVRGHILRCFSDPEVREKYDMLLMELQSVDEGKWAESAVFSVIQKVEKAVEMMGPASKMADVMNEAVSIFESIAWELLCRHEYNHLAIKEFVKGQMKERFETAVDIIEGLISEYENSDISKGTTITALGGWMFVAKDYLEKSLLALKRNWDQHQEHYSYRKVLFEEARSAARNPYYIQALTTVYADYLQGKVERGEIPEGGEAEYMEEGMERLFESIADYIVKNTKLREDFKEDYQGSEPVVLVFDEILTTIDYEYFRNIFGDRLKGILNAKSTAQSHFALAAKADGIPVLSIESEDYRFLESLSDNVEMYLFADSGQSHAVVFASSETKNEFDQEVKRINKRQNYYRKIAQASRREDELLTGANVSSLEQADRAFSEDYADFIGLVRTEALKIWGTILPPDINQIKDHFEKIVKSALGQPVVFRGFDQQPDKLSPAFAYTRYKGNKWYLEHPLGQEVVKQQLRAWIRLSKRYRFDVMFPMVEDESDLEAIDQLVREAASQEGVSDINFNLGIMVETNSAALKIDELLNKTIFGKRISFVSIGTNDYIRFTYDADRTNPMHVKEYYRDVLPSVVRMIRNSSKTVGESDVKTSICGDLASKENYWPVWFYQRYILGNQVALSMPSKLIPNFKAYIKAVEENWERISQLKAEGAGEMTFKE